MLFQKTHNTSGYEIRFIPPIFLCIDERIAVGTRRQSSKKSGQGYGGAQVGRKNSRGNSQV